VIVKRKIIDSTTDRQFLTGLIVSTEFIESALSFYDPDLIEVRFVKRIADWVIDYHKRYGKAPGIHIESIFEANVDQIEPSEKELIQDLLSSLSNQYERADQLNIQYLLDQVEKAFKLKSIERLNRIVNGHISQGDSDEAEKALSNYKRVGRPASLGENPFRSAETIARAFEREEKGLFTLPGRLGRMINRELNRDRFLAIMGGEKKGKTWWLNEFAIRAAKSRCNVALFQLGDMSEDQTVIRLSERLCNKSHLMECCGETKIPILDCMLGQQGRCHSQSKDSSSLRVDVSPEDIKEIFESRTHKEHFPCVECVEEKFFKGSVWYKKHIIDEPLKWREAWKVGKRFLCRTKGRDFRLSVHPSENLTVTGINGILDNWETFNDFIPDVIVIDYADNLAPEDRREEYRHQQNRTWKMLRGLSQERHCLVITATQANAKSYDQGLLSMKNFSEDKRKYAHVTAMIGLNQSEIEKHAGLMRINMIVQREGEFFTDKAVTVAQSLQTGRPFLFSF
jgi:hypothetical protein